MRQTNLLDRMNGRSEIAPPALEPGDATTVVLTGVARALRAATQPEPSPHQAMPHQAMPNHAMAGVRMMPVGRRSSDPGRIDAAQAVEAARGDAAAPRHDEITAELASALRTARLSATAPDHTPVAPIKRDVEELPLLLTTRNASPDAARENRTVRGNIAHYTGRYTAHYTTQYTAHILLGFSLLAIALLMTAPLPDIARTIGFDWTSQERRPKLARLAEPVSLDLAQNLLPDMSDANPPIVTLEDQVLLERCEAMIARGEIAEARDALTAAAASGRTLARFALAETFDPNVLAAWGLRENVADASAALIMYRQALEAGDRRASARIAALESEAATAVKAR